MKFVFYLLLSVSVFFRAYAADVADYSEFTRTVDAHISRIDEKFTITGVPGANITDFAKKYLEPNDKTHKAYSVKFLTTDDVTKADVDLTYFDDYKILSALKDPKLMNKLNKKDLLTLEIAEKIIAKYITKNMSEYEKILTIHNYIVLSAKYDKFAAGNPERANPDVFSAYGLLISRNAVCEGYARGMSLLLNMLDVETIVVSGTARKEPHAWNKVRIDSEWYNVDATFDSPLPYKKGVVSHEYFNVRDSDMVTHSWDKALYPPANATKYNYFVYNNLVVNNFEDFKQLIESGLKISDRVSVYVVGYSASKYPLNFLYGKFSYYEPEHSNGVFTVEKR